MIESREEAEQKKKAIFESMGKRGKERILRIGYENWSPFADPKDPREQIRGSIALKADEIMRSFYASGGAAEEARAFHFELLELAAGFLRGDLRARTIVEFCHWYKEKVKALD